MSHASKLDGAVLVELEAVAGAGQRLASARLVQHRCDRAVRQERDAQVRVLERQAVQPHLVAGLDGARGPERRGLYQRVAHDLPPREADGVHEGVPGRAERVRAGLHGGQVALGVLVDEPNARARKDVVELLQQQQLPEALELLAGMVAAQAGEELGVVQCPLSAPVAALRARLRGVDAAVVLEVQLTDDDGTVGALGLERSEELLARARRGAREALEVGRAPERLEHRPRRTPSPVAVAVDQQARARVVMVEVLARDLEQLRHADDAVVGVGRRIVREHLAAVVTLPHERVMVGPVEAVPRELLREEARDAGLAQDLRQLPGVAEGVRAPELAVAPAELALEPALAVQELARERLAGGQVAVGLDPAAADGDELPALDRRPDPLPEIRVALLDPRVLLRLRAGEAVLGVVLHVAELRAEAALHLAIRLGERPEPGRVDVRVPDRGQLVRVRRRLRRS